MRSHMGTALYRFVLSLCSLSSQAFFIFNQDWIVEDWKNIAWSFYNLNLPSLSEATVAPYSCSWLTIVQPNVLPCCCTPFALKFSVFFL